ncbi:DNA replication ATP-dependent helicase/nuclease JHS1-like [Miscanthus floridulus]|uniref:DNA replication ATP-dependent helicase/nuclease JHS1-like n=1 Tax=Miscanthus floridulus TaxID=154761 RepID=UPI0034579CE2
MPPKRRAAAAASSKKPQPSQPSQPAKFGIPHFFERQTQASQNAKRQKPDPPAPPPPPPPPEEEPSEVSPEVTKTLAPKRVRFSPGMLIKQSQDDGAAEVVTWKLSPVNHRLGTAKSKQFLGMAPHPYSSEKNSSLEAMKKWHSSPLGLSRCTTSGRNSGVLGSALVGCDGVEDTQSPFRTPPSLSYGCNEQLSSGVTSEGDLEPLGAGQHKKALLDLLDQVEDAIMEEELPVDPGNKGGQTTNKDNTNNNCYSVADGDLTIPSKKTINAPLFNSFLVLEVSEKHKADDSSCDRYPVKILRLLNEHSGKECAVHLCDEWFHSIVGPGDTVNVIGEFSNQGKCIVDHDNNLVIVHPELLISGTRVASSFHCPRRSVLDDRLKSNEYSTSALTGTLLHQVFQAGLLKDAPSRQFLEQQAKEVLLKNIETLYACGDAVLNANEAFAEEEEDPARALAGVDVAGVVAVAVSLPRRLRIPDSNSLSEQQDLTREIWRIDKDEFSSSFAIMRLNLVQLFAQNPQNPQLRKLIVDLEAPRFDSGGLFSQDPALSYIRSLPNLNNDQQRSLHKILGAKDYALILGMPGTGKTYTMVHAVKSLLIRGESILLTSYTNSAIDTLLMKLKTEGVDFIRIGRPEAVHPDVRAHCLSTTEAQSVDAIKARMEQVQVVGVTCLGMYHPLLAHKKFDTCIMDEAGQITLPVSLGPLMLATKFVLVGDHYQLPPLVQSSEARENGMGISLFWRLSEAHPQAISALRCQYRMSSGIMELSNSLIYGNRLCCGSLEIANAKLKFSGRERVHLKLKEILNPDRAVIFANTDQIPALEAKEHRTVNNPTEAHIISWIIKELLRRGVAQDAIGIITPYNAQVNIIQQCTDGLVEVHTIDKYQGRDKECIIVSFMRSTANSRACGSSLLGDWHRINVLLTRAKKKFIMVGSRGTLSTIPLLRLLVDKVAEIGGLLDLTNKDVHSLSRT